MVGVAKLRTKRKRSFLKDFCVAFSTVHEVERRGDLQRRVRPKKSCGKRKQYEGNKSKVRIVISFLVGLKKTRTLNTHFSADGREGGRHNRCCGRSRLLFGGCFTGPCWALVNTLKILFREDAEAMQHRNDDDTKGKNDEK